jgi:hypothetical protein
MSQTTLDADYCYAECHVFFCRFVRYRNAEWRGAAIINSIQVFLLNKN